VSGYLQSESLRNGISDTTGVPLESYTYLAHIGYVA